ncbi:MAG: pneumococcal-type histidine triad protein [Flavobacteriaceae bacterium]|jgi:hypothetical protein|nr:pneumococcal-type histidine triad protein [Flavobacteriaceae bacterium]
MRKLSLSFLLLICCFTTIHAQKNIYRTIYDPIFNVEYNYNGHTQLKAGLEHLLSENNFHYLGIGALWTQYQDKGYVIPYAHYQYIPKDKLYFAKLTASTKHLQPTVGLSLLNIFDIGVGYAIPFDQNNSTPVIKGVTLSINLRITNNQKAYQSFKVM